MNSLKVNLILLFAVRICGLMLHRQIRPASPVKPVGQPVQIKVLLGLPPAVIPADNLPTAETIALGRRLFYDPILSADRGFACASRGRDPISATLTRDQVDLPLVILGIMLALSCPG